MGGLTVNFVYMSPQFPKNFYHFCEGLKNNGVTVLGLGDTPYEELSQELKASLTEYYKVDSLENYDEVYRACAFFTFCRKKSVQLWRNFLRNHKNITAWRII